LNSSFIETDSKGQRSIAVASQGLDDRFGTAGSRSGCPTQISFPLLAHAGRQVAGPCRSVLDLTGRGNAESLLGTFMCLLLGHDLALNAGDERVWIQLIAEPRIIRK
jgi:hypothetical protein